MLVLHMQIWRYFNKICDKTRYYNISLSKSYILHVLYSIIIVGSQINITGASNVMIGGVITQYINTPEAIINHMKRNQKEEDVRRK